MVNSGISDLVIASANAGKLAELSAQLEPLGICVHAQAEFGLASVPETGLTFVENALLKARAACQGSHLPALADDSGLVVPALNGAPGLYSATYASPNGEAGRNDAANNVRLLAELAARPESSRRAYFFCVIVLLRQADDPAPLICEGRWQGHIASSARGEGGFGYDPLFCPDDSPGRSAAELSRAEKIRLSHRGKALAQLTDYLSSRA